MRKSEFLPQQSAKILKENLLGMLCEEVQLIIQKWHPK
jgi:hypothetical protein